MVIRGGSWPKPKASGPRARHALVEPVETAELRRGVVVDEYRDISQRSLERRRDQVERVLDDVGELVGVHGVQVTPGPPRNRNIRPGGARLVVRVVPRHSRTGLVGT